MLMMGNKKMGKIIFVNSPYINRNSDVIMPPFAIAKMVNSMENYKDRILISLLFLYIALFLMDIF